jgi:hypothetical protein
LCFICLTVDICECTVVLVPILDDSVPEQEIVKHIRVLLRKIETDRGINKIRTVTRLFSYIFSNFNIVLENKQFHDICVKKCYELIPQLSEPQKTYFCTWHNILKMFHDQY